MLATLPNVAAGGAALDCSSSWAGKNWLAIGLL